MARLTLYTVARQKLVRAAGDVKQHDCQRTVRTCERPVRATPAVHGDKASWLDADETRYTE